MNPGLTTVTTKTFTDTINLNEPFVLFLGRTPQTISEPSRIDLVRDYSVLHNEEDPFGDLIPPTVQGESYRLFIGDKLFSTTRPSGRRRFSMKIVKSKKNEPIQVHLVKKYTQLAA